jgi:hypothetical protein
VPLRDDETVSQRMAVIFTILAVVTSTTGCDSDENAFERAVGCFRKHHAIIVDYPSLSRMATTHGWKVRRAVIDSNGLVIIGTRTDAAARKAGERVAAAAAALDSPQESRVEIHQSGPVVYWWDNRPSPANVALAQRCVA